MTTGLLAGSRRRRRERAYRRALAVGLFLSGLAHLVALLITGRIALSAGRYEPRPGELEPAPEGLVVVEVEEPEVAPPPEQPAPEPPRPRPRRPDETEVIAIVPAPEQAEEAVPAEEAEAEPVSNAERLRLRFADARLWVDPRDPLLYGERLERFARADSAVRTILRDWLDSLRLTEEQRRRAMDWTFEKDGKRWGISPEGLHLGDITIPIPFQVMPTGPQRRAFEQALRDLREIQNQDLRSDVEEVGRERMEEMRRRSREEVERRRRSDTTAVRPPPSPG